jgi:hypothetical protein
VKGKLSAEDMRVQREIAEQVVLGDGLPSIKEMQIILGKAFVDSCKPDLAETECLRLTVLVEGAKLYVELAQKQINYLVNCFVVKESF